MNFQIRRVNKFQRKYFLDCVHEARDKVFNMGEKYSGVQAILKKNNEDCILSSFANHTLNLVGTNCADTRSEVITFL